MIIIKFYRVVDKISKLKKSESLRKKLFNTARARYFVSYSKLIVSYRYKMIDVSAKNSTRIEKCGLKRTSKTIENRCNCNGDMLNPLSNSNKTVLWFEPDKWPFQSLNLNSLDICKISWKSPQLILTTVLQIWINVGKSAAKLKKYLDKHW